MLNRTLHARVRPDHVAKLEKMQQATGWKPSQLLRLFVEHAELQDASTISVIVSAKGNTDATSQQAERIGVE